MRIFPSVVLLVLLWPARALGEPVRLQPIPPGEDRIEVLGQGQSAPYSGHLFDPRTALRWGNYLEQCRMRLDKDVELATRKGDLEAGFWKAKLDLEREHMQGLLKEQHAQILKLSEPRVTPLYERPWFMFSFGLVVAGTLFYVGTQAR